MLKMRLWMESWEMALALEWLVKLLVQRELMVLEVMLWKIELPLQMWKLELMVLEAMVWKI
jgi:hypothetical protein